MAVPEGHSCGKQSCILSTFVSLDSSATTREAFVFPNGAPGFRATSRS